MTEGQAEIEAVGSGSPAPAVPVRAPRPVTPGSPLASPDRPAAAPPAPAASPSVARSAQPQPRDSAPPRPPAARQGWLAAALWLALPALVLTEWFKVLSLAGSDFRSGGNGLPLSLALAIPLLGAAVRSRGAARAARALSGAAGLAGVVLYASVHRSAWAEGAAWQAWILALLGAAASLWHAALPRPQGLPLAVGAVPLVLAHAASLWFVHAPVLALSALLLIAADTPPPTRALDRRGWCCEAPPSALWAWIVGAPLFELGLGGQGWSLALAAGLAGLAASASGLVLASARRWALLLPLSGLLAFALAQGMPWGPLGTLLAGLAGLGLGALWRHGGGAPSSGAIAIGLALCYLQSQRDLLGLPVLVLSLWVLRAQIRAPRAALGPALP